MSPESSSRGRPLLVAGARFVAHWVALSVVLLPFAFVVSALNLDYTWLFGGAALGLAAIAVDRDVAVTTTAAASLVALPVFVVLQAAAGGALGDPPTAWTVGAASVAYLAAAVVARTDVADHARALADPEQRGRARD